MSSVVKIEWLIQGRWEDESKWFDAEAISGTEKQATDRLFHHFEEYQEAKRRYKSNKNVTLRLVRLTGKEI